MNRNHDADENSSVDCSVVEDDLDEGSDNEDGVDDDDVPYYANLSPRQILRRLQARDPNLRYLLLDCQPHDFRVGSILETLDADQTESMRFMAFFCDLTALLPGISTLRGVEVDFGMWGSLTETCRRLLFHRISEVPGLREFRVKDEMYEVHIRPTEYEAVLRQANKLEVFRIPDLTFRSQSEFSSLAGALRGRRSTLRQVDLGSIHYHGQECRLDPLASVLASMPRLESLSVCKCRQTPLKIQEPALRSICRSKSLTSLVFGCFIEDDECVVLADELATNERLKVLNLRYNDIGTTGADALLRMMDRNLTLEDVQLDGETEHAHAIQILARLNRAGRKHLLDDKVPRERSVRVLSNVSDDLDALYTALRLKPDLCNLSEHEHRIAGLRDQHRALRLRAIQLEQEMEKMAEQRNAIEERKRQLEVECHELLGDSTPPQKKRAKRNDCGSGCCSSRGSNCSGASSRGGRGSSWWFPWSW